eukprot:maker-scaffold368_size193847-snap-gene-0.31 protein:Tk09996 transcript:maker-scaffold368_size193847-snap-gene-0.31-mRNA-1 annotation:"tropomyosin- isoforms 33 34"
MDTIRSKIYLLHNELSQALFSASRAEDTSSTTVSLAKGLEVKQRDLMKSIANKENDLDKMMEQLEKAQKSIYTKERGFAQAKEDKRTLTADIEYKEQLLKRNKERYESTMGNLKTISSRSETMERSRKEMEHRVLSFEETIDKLTSNIREARFLTDEASRKFDEATYKIEKIDQVLDRSLVKADQAESNEEILEDKLKRVGNALTQKVAVKEKSGKREDHLKQELRHLQAQLQEAEHRAEMEEDEEKKLEALAKVLKKKKMKK